MSFNAQYLSKCSQQLVESAIIRAGFVCDGVFYKRVVFSVVHQSVLFISLSAHKDTECTFSLAQICKPGLSVLNPPYLLSLLFCCITGT